MDLPQKVRAPNPWAFFGYFLSQQKVTPRRGGETRQMAFRTRQDCEGETIAWQSKKTRLLRTKTLYPGPRGRHVQEAALWACLEGQTDKPTSAWRSPRLGNGQSRYRPRLVTSHRRKKKGQLCHPFLMPYFLPRPVWKDAASSRGVSPAAAVDQALSALDPDRTDVR